MAKKDPNTAFITAALSKESTREHMSRPFVQALDSGRWIVSTDGHRIHAIRDPRLDDRTDIKEGQHVVISEQSILPVPDSPLTPNAREVIPRGVKGLCIVKIETEVLAQLALAGHKTVGTKCRVHIEMSPEGVRVVGDRAPTTTGAGYFHPRYIGEAILGLKQADVRIEIRGVMEPAIIRGEGAEDRFAVVMPLRH